ncbi:FUSC family protein [Variovorax saccharolyticus]|uniref:FUSC family protein n=1 Tax=Variovorax saccharolyticus TaxID=3053516 RepID=UPI002576129B|nr:FUSC family protein [Variovorax sp. J22R187]MDM0022814.1 FUSC family protein [Variovorax sp. J22R187]
MNLFAARNVVYALNCYVAAMLALAIAFAFDLENPYWAALTVYVTSQPLSGVVGAVWGRAFYRLLGTAAALSVAILIIPNLVDMPVLMVSAIGAWVALCTYLSLLDRSPRSYAFMLSGYTTALVGLPVVTDPSRIFDTAVARTEEVAIGVLCAAIVQTLFFPRHAGDLLRAKLRAALSDMQALIASALDQGTDPSHSVAARRKLAVTLSDIHALSDNLRFENATAGDSAVLVRALEQDLVALVPLLSAVGDQLPVLRGAGSLPPAMSMVAGEVRAWVVEDPASGSPRANALIEACRSAAPTLGPHSSWIDILTANHFVQLESLVIAWDRSLALSDAVLNPGGSPATLPMPRGIVPRRRLHVDHGMAAYTGLAAGLAVVAAGAYAMTIGWSQGAVAVGITAAASMVFAVADDPTPAQRLLALLTLVAVPVAAAYQLAVFPLLDGFAMLAFALFPFLMLTGLLLATPQYAMPGFGFALASQTLISLQPSAQGDLVTVVNIGVAVVIGALIALWVTQLIRVVPPPVAVRRILRAGWRDMGRLAVGFRPLKRGAWASLMLDREALLQPRLARSAQEGNPLDADVVSDLRVGIHVIGLRDAAHDAATFERAPLHRLLTELGAHFGALGRGREPADPISLLARIDDSIRSMLDASRCAAHDRAVIASVGLRRNLFPEAPDFRYAEASA